MLPVIPAGILELLIIKLAPGLEDKTFAAIALSNLLVIGPIEEFGKYLIVKRFAVRHPAFNEPLDGIVYAAASALGFAALENFFYLSDNGPWLVLLRGPLSTLDHVLFSAVWGYALGMASVQTDPGVASRLVRNGLIFGALGHGLSNVLLLAPQSDINLAWSPLLAILMAVVMYRQVARNITTSLASSPLQLTTPHPAFGPIKPVDEESPTAQ